MENVATCHTSIPLGNEIHSIYTFMIVGLLLTEYSDETNLTLVHFTLAYPGIEMSLGTKVPIRCTSRGVQQ